MTYHQLIIGKCLDESFEVSSLDCQPQLVLKSAKSCSTISDSAACPLGVCISLNKDTL